MILKKLKLTRCLDLSLLGLLMIFYSISCKNEKEQKKIPEINVKVKREMPPIDSMPFAVAVRQIKELNYLFECNHDDNYYQVSLSKNYDSNNFVLTFRIKNDKIDTLYFTHFIPGSDGKFKKNKHFYLVNSRDNQSLICYYSKPKLIKLTKNNENLVNYFDKTIWTIQDKIAKNKAMDGDTYLVYGRKNNQAITLYRNSYGDTLFNTNMKALINLCKIRDFKLGIFK